MTLSIIIVNYQTKKFLKTCLKSVFNQKTSTLYEVILIDNNSEDLTELKKNFPKIILLTNSVNIGFTGAVNQGILMSEADYIMTLNPDVILEPDYLENCLAVFKDEKVASATGKLLNYDYKNNKKTDIIDTTGLVMKKTRHAYDRGQGEKDQGQYDTKKNVWGVSAAAAVYRRSALDAIKDRYGYFDNRFFMYKDDVDVAWRLQKNGYQARLVPEAITYHRRGTGIIDPTFSLFKNIGERKKTKSTEVRILSFRNQRLMQKKNGGFSVTSFLYEIGVFLYVFIFERELLKKYSEIFKLK